MSSPKKWLYRFFLWALSTPGCLALSAQQLSQPPEISVRVQVNRMPDGRYPTKIYQFNTTPGLVTLTLVNLTNAPRSLYLSGKLTGDNGVTIATAKNYQPPVLIELPPFATRTLNAIEASYLFDVNNLVYLSGNTSIKSSVFGEQGLPEGAYQLCIRAIDAATRRPLSDEDPMGCSNIFTVTTLEPPVILNPYNEQALPPLDVQNIPLRWTTPPGASPSTEYLVRIVEIFGQRNPYDAILSTPTPFFETTVKGSPLFLYSIQHPRLQEGRSYAMIVIASDPLGGATFRNKGQSEVVEFTYGKTEGLHNNAGTDQHPGNGPPVEYANHILSGRLSWAFKKTETGSYTLQTGSGDYIQEKSSVLQDALAGADQKSANQTTRSIMASPYLAASLSGSGFAMQKSLTPLISLNALAAVNTDPTLQKFSSVYAKETTNSNGAIAALALPTGILSGSGSTLTDCSYETITVDSATERYALPGVSVTLHAVFASGLSRNTLLATGQTDKDGNFSLRFLDPAYGSRTGAIGLVLSVRTDDFENTNIRLPLTVLNKEAADIGNYTLLAKTLRLFPKLVFDQQAEDNGYGIHIYRDIQELQDRPWLLNEGQTNADKKTPVTLEGRQMMEIAADSVIGGSGSGRIRAALSKLDAKGAGRIFFGGNLYVKLTPSASGYYDQNSAVNVLKVPIPAGKILLARVEYRPTHKPASIGGTVGLPLAGKGMVPVQGATVRVLYKKADRVPGTLDPNDIIQQTAPAVTGLASQWTDHPIKDPGITSLQAVLYTIQGQGLRSPVMLQPKGNNEKSLIVQSVLKPSDWFTPGSTVPDDSKALTTTTDELGKYYIGLPPLKKGAAVTVEVINTPADFRKFAIEARGYRKSKAALALEQGASAQVDFDIRSDVADVVGRVVDDKGKPLANARVNFKGNTLGSTGPDGIFQFSLYPGSHTLSLEKEGYVVKEVVVDIPQLTNGNSNAGDKGYASKWLGLTVKEKQEATLTRISQTQTVQASVSRGNVFSPKMFGIADAHGIAAASPSPASPYEVPGKIAIDLKDIGYLDKIVGKARFRVVEEGSNTALAGVNILVFDTSHVTDTQGEWYYEGFGGRATLTLIPPAHSGYVTEQRSMVISETGKEERITITLKKGVLVTGMVSSGNTPLAGARILLDDKDFTGTTTDASGHYAVYTTPGAHKLGARKQGYVGSDYPAKSIPENNPVNFDLKGSSGRNYSSLLGFAIELDETLPAGGGQEKWSGNFVRLRPVDENVFGVAGETRIPFSNLVVSFDPQGNPQPLNNRVKTDLTELPLKLFGYLPVKLVGEDVIVFTRAADGRGQLNGKIKIAFNAIQGYRGWVLNENTSLLLAKAGSPTAGTITAFSSAGAQPADNSYALVAENASGLNGQLYGFGVALNNGAVVDKEGIQFAGAITTPELGPIHSLSIKINKLAINRALSVSAVLLQQDGLPSLGIASWKAAIQSLIFNEDGFKIGGGLALEIPRSGVSQVSFSDLIIAKSGIFGGSFTIPETGIDILSLANLSTDGAPLSFGRVGNSSVYRIGGKASFKINVAIMEKAFKVPFFEVLTNGDFSIQTPVDYSTTIGPFGFAVTNLFINSKDNTPSIGIQGEFKADLSFLKFEVGDISIRPSGGRPVFSIGKLGVKLDVPVVTASASVSFKENGFEGDGNLGLAGTPVNVSVGFKYYKRPGGIELGAKFFTNIPPVPIGVVVTLDGIGGGFDYRSGGPNGGFSVDVRGKISFLGMGPAVAVNPIGITVESAGILRGYGDIVIGSYLKTGHAEVVFNGPDRTFTIQVDVSMSPIEGLAEAAVQGALVISAKKDDEFAFLGTAMQVKLLGLIDNHGEMAIAIRVKHPKTRGDLVSHYFEYAPDDYMRESFSGVYLNSYSHMGIPRDKALGFDLFIASAKLWLESGFQASLLLNLDENAFRIRFGGKFDVGAEACVAKIACVGISAAMCYLIEGGRNNTAGWNFRATATGNASLSFGLGVGNCNPGCNEFNTVWNGCFGGAFKICGNASLDLNFSERNGLHFNARAGGDTTPCF